MPEISARIVLEGKDNASKEIKKVKDAVNELGKVAQKQSGFMDELLGSQAARFFSAAAITGGIAHLVKESLTAADALEGVENRAKTLYGGAFPAMEQEAERLAVSLNRSSSDMLKLVTAGSTLAAGFDIPTKEMEKMGVQLAGLSVDFASFYRIADDQAFDTLSAAVRGNGRALQEYGIFIKDELIESHFNLSKGMKVNMADLNESQKMWLRYNYILDKTSVIQGDAAKTSGNMSNQIKSIGGAWEDMMEEMGKKELPTANFILRGINATLKNMPGALAGADQVVRSLGRAFLDQIPGMTMFLNGLKQIQMASAQAAGPVPFFMGKMTSQASPIVETDKELQNMLDTLGQLGGGGGGGAGEDAADALDEIKDAMEELGSEYESASRDINLAIVDLERNHKEKMRSLQDDLDGVSNSLVKLQKEYDKTVQKTTQNEAGIFAKQGERLGSLQNERLSLMNSPNALSSEQMVSVLANRGIILGKQEAKENPFQSITAKETQAFGLSSDAVQQLNLELELQKEQAAFEKYGERRKSLEKEIAEEKQMLRATDTEREIARMDEQKMADKERFDEQKIELDERKTKIEGTMVTEQEAFISARQEYEDTRVKLEAFHNSYVTNMADIDNVTKDTVKSLKTQLSALKETISQIDALMASNADVTGGQTLTDAVRGRRAERLETAPSNFLPQLAEGGIVTRPTVALIGEQGPEAVVPLGKMGGVNIGEIHVHNEADEDRLVAKIARTVRLQQLQAA